MTIVKGICDRCTINRLAGRRPSTYVCSGCHQEKCAHLMWSTDPRILLCANCKHLPPRRV